MQHRPIDYTRIDEDWEGNNVAVTCPTPECKKVFVVSARIHDGKRKCPKCGKSTVTIRGGRKSGGEALLSW